MCHYYPITHKVDLYMQKMLYSNSVQLKYDKYLLLW